MPQALLSASLYLDVQLDQGSAPPTEFRILRAGANPTVDDPAGYLFDEQAATDVLSAAKSYGNKFALDYGHGMFADRPSDPAEAGKAAGWFSLAVRQGELWATDVKWTRKASGYLSEKEYRYLSPAFRYDAESKRVTRLLNVALTNVPRLTELVPLVAASQTAEPTPAPEKPRMDPKQLAALLSLKADASETDIGVALAAQVASTRELLAFCGTSNVSEALGMVRGWKDKASQAEALAAQMAAQTAAAQKAEVDALLAQAVTAGKVMPAEREYLAKLAQADLAGFKGYMAARTGPAAPALIPGAAVQPGATSATATLSQADLEVARMMGVDPKKLAEHKTKLTSPQ
jgi:phage I-like protein